MEITPFELLTLINALTLDKEILGTQDINRYHFVTKLQTKLFKLYDSYSNNIIYPDNFQ